MKKILLVVSCVFLISTLWAQQINMPITGNSQITTSSCTLYDDGGPSLNYSTNSNSSYTIETPNEGTYFSIVGSYDLEEYNKSRLVIYDGGSTSTTIIGSYYGGIGTINICSNSSSITVRFFSDTDTPHSGFSLNIIENTCPRPFNLEVTNVTTTSAHLEWDGGDGTTIWIVECTSYNIPNGQNTFTTNSNSIDITGLNPYENYTFSIRSNCTPVTNCSYASQSFMTLCPCPEPTYIHTTLGDRTLTVNWTEPDTNIIWTITMTYDYQIFEFETTDPTYVFENLPFDFEYYVIVITSDCAPYFLSCNPGVYSYYPPPPPPPPPFECECSPALSPQVTNVGLNSVDISWNSASNTVGWILQYGIAGSGDWIFDTVYTNSCTLTSLEPITKYECYIHSYCDNLDIRCRKYCKFFTYRDDCFNFLDLSGSNCLASYGTFDSPFERQGLVDYGPNSMKSKHTIVKDTIGKDPRTNYMLSFVPPTEKASVRLGNWDIGAESESIDYLLYVDTNNFDLLLLKYAIVLQDPNHEAGRQPRFLLSIWNEQGRIADETCGYVNFYSSGELGWNEVDSSNVIWKDWTTMGLDLTNYHGTRISIKLTTFDCQEGGHYGYAYYTLGCSSKYETKKTCGKVDSISLEAPEGFFYSWFFENNPDTIISKEKEIKVLVDNSVIYCQCTSTENSLCYFTIKYIAQRNYPYSQLDYQVDSCSKEVTFYNRSIVSNNDSIPIGTQLCEDIRWIFPDGTESDLDTIKYSFDTLGQYPIILISNLNRGDCVDTLFQNITISPYYIDTIEAKICEAQTYSENGFYQSTEGIYSINHITPNGCDSLIVLDLKVFNKFNNQIYDTICKGDNYHNYGFDCSTSGMYSQQLQSLNGCDSTITLYLTQIQAFPDYSIIEDKYILVEDFPITIDVTTASTDHYFWNTGSTSPIIEVNQPGSYYVTFYTNCGEIYDSILIAVPVVEVFVPNAFTPLSDKNNTFFPVFENIEKLIIKSFEIYNRWGEKIYSSTKIPWDGKYKGRLVENGVYIWRLIYMTKYTQDEIFSKTGEVNIIK